MENASKALLMAGGVLLGIMLLSVFVYVFREGAKASKSVEQSKIEQELIKENARFEIYNKDDNTISDMVSLINLVYDYNFKKDFNETDCMQLNILLGSVSAGGLTYSIPNNNIDNLLINSSDSIVKNKVLRNNEAVSVYELTSKTLGEIQSDTIPFVGNISSNTYSANALLDDLLTKTHFDGGKTTTYKYLFNNTSIHYNKDSGHIDSIEFVIKINELWEPEWDN